MVGDAETIAARIIADIAPKDVLGIGGLNEALIARLRAAGCHVSSIGARPGWIKGRYDLILCGGFDTLTEDEHRRLIWAICAATDEVLVNVEAAKPASYWIERFAPHDFADVDWDPSVRGAPLRFRKTRTRHETNARLASEVGRLRETADTLHRLVDEKDRLITDLKARIAAHESTLGWKLLEWLRPLGGRVSRHAVSRHAYAILRRSLEVLLEEGPKEVMLKVGHKIRLAVRGRNFMVQPRREPPRDVEAQYQLWLPHHQLTDEDRRSMEGIAARLRIAPTVSILVVVDVAHDSAWRSAIEALTAQIYERWQLCVSVGLGVGATTKRLLSNMAAADPRIQVGANDGVGPAAATALSLAGGEFVGFVEIADVLAPQALLDMVRRLNEIPEADVVYSDEDALDLEGHRVRPFFKPDWSPDLLLSTNYVGRFVMLRRKLLDDVGGFRPNFVGAEFYDLILRAVERARNIAHVPSVLYHRQIQVPSVDGMKVRETVVASECLALGEALQRRGLEGRVEPLPSGPHALRHYSVRYRLRGEPLVSIIIPTRDKSHLLAQCIRSIEEKTRYERYEIIIVDNDSRQPETLRYFATLKARHRVQRYPGRFNFSAINNVGAAQTKGEHLLFLNNDIEVIRPDWLEAMLEHAQRPDVGAVGAKLLYPDGRIQHGGVVVGVSGAAVHAFRLWPGEDERGPRLCDVVRNCTAVTAACMMVPRRVFGEVGGFDERLRVVFQDVDLCLKMRARGYLVVYTPFALLYHHEGASRGRLHPTPDEKLFQQRWKEVLAAGDPYYNPNLTEKRDDWSLRLD